jgi:hypothetical protein
VAEEIKRVQLEFGRNAAIELTYGYERHDKAFISIGYMNREDETYEASRFLAIDRDEARSIAAVLLSYAGGRPLAVYDG